MLAENTTLNSRRVGNTLCVLTAGTALRADSTEQAVSEAIRLMLDGGGEFVFDLRYVGRYDTGALRGLADLWQRMHGMGRQVHVVIGNPAVAKSLGRILNADGAWTRHFTVRDAMTAALSTPI